MRGGTIRLSFMVALSQVIVIGAMHMEIRHTRIENLERILRELMEIHAMALGAQAYQFRMWLDLAITETQFQIEKMRMETIH